MGLIRAGGLLATISLGCSDSDWLWRSCWCGCGVTSDIGFSALAVPDVFAKTGVEQSVDLGIKSILRTSANRTGTRLSAENQWAHQESLIGQGRHPSSHSEAQGQLEYISGLTKKINGWPATNQTDAHLLPEAAAIASLARSSSLLLSLHSHFEWNLLERRAARHWSHWVRGRPFFLISKRARSE